MIEKNRYTETLPPAFSFDMIHVEGGEFDMGGNDQDALNWEKPVHRVKLDTFSLGKYPVTQALWKAVMGEASDPSGFKGDQRPVETISWEEIVNNFLPELNRITAQSRPAGTEYRLPTEAEWEYAARGGKHHSPYLYAGSNKLKEVGWYNENSYNETKPVGLKDPNELGLYDMSGNVYEWCSDWFDEKYYESCHKKGAVLNPCGPEEGVYRVVRGGGYFDGARHCRVSYRDRGEPGNRIVNFGFRLALPPQSVG